MAPLVRPWNSLYNILQYSLFLQDDGALSDGILVAPATDLDCISNDDIYSLFVDGDCDMDMDDLDALDDLSSEEAKKSALER